MTLHIYKYSLSLLVAAALSVAGLVSCSDKDMPGNVVPEKPEASEPDPSMAFDGYSIGLSIGLDEPSAIAEVTDYDDYIETKDHFRVFFFDHEGKFLVNTMDRTVTPLGTDDDGRKKFFVRIPMNYIIDRDNNQFDVEALKKKLREKPFKIAIIANWPNPIGNPDSQVQNEKTPRYPNWGWNHSVLNPEVNRDSLKTIHDFHFLASPAQNNYYKENEKVFGFLQKDGKMGITVDWFEEKEGELIGKMPLETEDFFIPMYGVQDYPELGDHWKEGTTFNLSVNSVLTDSSDGNTEIVSTYSGKDLLLIRSVAKVEVYMNYKPEGGLKLYNVNRTARCEPVDVSTPIEENWPYQSLGDIRHDLPIKRNNTEELCEWYLIGNHGKTYNSSITTLDSYQNWLSWFYGTWTEAGQGFNEMNKPEGPYPHVFNPDINKVTSVKFNEERPNGEWFKYVLYLPEVYMDDLSVAGNRSSEPLIPYVEYKNQEGKNLRFYFSDSQPTKGIDPKSVVEECDLWPILRNHIYTFYVIEEENKETPTSIQVRARVMDWGYNRLTNQW